jgi:tryptophan synthase alpha chain
MTYLNPVFSYGYDRFFKRASEASMLGIIIPDMPFEEREEAASIAKKYNIKK